MVLTHQEGDKSTDCTDKHIVIRKTHINKSVCCSFFANELASWILRHHQDSASPVSFGELVEAVATAVRWTLSASAWKMTLREVTGPSPVNVLVPEELVLSPGIVARWAIGKIDGQHLLQFPSGHQSPLPMTVLCL